MPDLRRLDGALAGVLHLEEHTDLFSELRKFLTEGGWTEVVITGCAGSLEKAIANYPRDMTLPPIVDHVVMEGAYEVCTLNGNVTWQDGKPRVHIHGSFAEKGTKVYGGAIGDGTRIFKSADLFVLCYK